MFRPKHVKRRDQILADFAVGFGSEKLQNVKQQKFLFLLAHIGVAKDFQSFGYDLNSNLIQIGLARCLQEVVPQVLVKVLLQILTCMQRAAYLDSAL